MSALPFQKTCTARLLCGLAIASACTFACSALAESAFSPAANTDSAHVIGSHKTLDYAQRTESPVDVVDVPSNLIYVPLTRQATDYTCGAAAVQSVLGFFGEDWREDQLSHALHSKKRSGTNYAQIVKLARARGYEVSTETDYTIAKLKDSITSGVPVICLIQAWRDKPTEYSNDWNDGHYVVAVGFDSDNIFFMDPSTLGHYAYIPSAEFLSRWHDVDGRERLQHFALVIKKPGERYSPVEAKRMY